MRRIVKTERNAKGEITSQEVIKPKQLTNFHPLMGHSKESLKDYLSGIYTDVRYSGKEKGFYVN